MRSDRERCRRSRSLDRTPKHNCRRRTSLPPDWTETSSQSKPVRDLSNTHIPTENYKETPTDFSIASKIFGKRPEDYFLKVVKATNKDNVTSSASLHPENFFTEIPIAEQFKRVEKRRISDSTASNLTKQDSISKVLQSPYRKNLAKSKVISSGIDNYIKPKKNQPDDEFDRRTPPPSPAPYDPELERIRYNRLLRSSEEKKPQPRFKPDKYVPPKINDFRLYDINLEADLFDSIYAFLLRTKREIQETLRRREFRHRNNYYYGIDRSMDRMRALEDHERKVIIEFCHLLEKSKQLFNGLRELPQYGHKQWHSYFGRTFDVYTKLWKFQQAHRATLDTKYGLKRWQIGEIASKIGQLYYHFYLRTSETAYLNEAFSFYAAIRGRSYYTKACKEDKCELMVKKLRYYARFIVVCLLLKKMKLVKELIKELDRQIIEYGNNYDPDDHIEWTVVVDEVKNFIHTENVVSVIHPDNYAVILSHRLNPLTTPPIERTAQMTLSLQEVLIVGSSSQQVKFSELTMDMFRMLQTLERELSAEIQHMYDESPRQRYISTPNAPNTKSYLDGVVIRDNPHKYLLFKPSPSQILVYLASGCNDLPPNGALLLYISADGLTMQPSKHSEDTAGYESGGLITTSKSDIYRECSKDPKASSSRFKEPLCLYPGDLIPFTRRPLFIIIDSDNSYAFQNIPRLFGQPLVILMSPLEMPTNCHDRRQQGSLFTMFLHSPLTAFCYCCDIPSMSLVHWERAQTYVEAFLNEACQILVRSRIDPEYLSFIGDDYLRLLILRFVFCEVSLRLHRAFRARTHLTRSSPQIPDELIDHPSLEHIMLDLATHLQVRSHFHDSSGSGPLASKD